MTFIPASLILRIHASTEAGMRSSTPCAIVAILAEHGPLTMEQIRARLKLSREGVNKFLIRLTADGIITVEKRGVSKVGRVPNWYRLAV